MTEFNFLKEFALDANEQLEKIEQAVINLEKKFSKDDIEELLRAFHTLKGNSSIAGLNDIMDISHAVEGITGDVKNRIVPMSPEITDIVLTSVDAIKQLLKSGALKKKQANVASLVARIAKVRHDLKAAGTGTGAVPPRRKLIIRTTDDLAILGIPEFFDEDYVRDMREVLISLHKRGITRYVFNFRASQSVSSGGVSELVATKKQMETMGAKTASCGMSPAIEKAFQAIGKSGDMNMKNTLKEAVSSI